MRWVDEAEDCEWENLDAALRAVARPSAFEEPPIGLRDQCLPGECTKGDRAGPLRVLVVDDEPNIIRLIEYHLRSAGYLVHSARDGSEALASVHEVRPAIIVLDVMMPGLDGWTVLQALKSDPETAAIPVLMLTALGSDDHVRRSWQKGTDFHLCKPFNPVELVSVVHRLAVSLDSPDAPPPLRRWLK